MRASRSQIFLFAFLAITAAFLLGPLSSPSLAATDRWKSIGPWGGDKYDVIIDRADNRILYLVGGGIHKSIDGGESWQAAMKTTVPTGGLYAYSLAIDPRDSSRLYAGTLSGVWRSTDAAGQWEPANGTLPKTDQIIRSMVIDAANPDVLYISLVSKAGDVEAGIYKSQDRGESWTPFTAGLPQPFTEVTCIFQNPLSKELFAGTYGDGIFRLDADAQKWVPSSAGLKEPLGLFITDMTFDLADEKVIYAATKKNWVYKSGDGGATWESVALPEPLTADYPAMAYFVRVDPNNSQVLWIGAIPGSDRANEAPFYESDKDQGLGGLFQSVDGGSTWREVKQDFGGFGLTIDPSETVGEASDLRSRQLYLASGGITGIQRSDDGGKSFTAKIEGVNSGWINGFYQHPLDPSVLFAWAEGQNFFSFDSGENWSGFFPHGNQEIIYTWSMAIDPASPDRLLYATGNPSWAWPENKGLYEIDLTTLNPKGSLGQTTGTQLPATAGIGIWSVYPFAGSIYLATQDRGILKSSDHGESWQDLSKGLAETSVTCIAFDRDESPLFAGTRTSDGSPPGWFPSPEESGALYSWSSGAKEWTRAAGITSAVFDIVPMPDRPDRVLAGAADGFYVSGDGGASWTKKTFGLPASVTVSDIEIDPENPRRVFLSTWYQGVFASVDGGEHWSAYNRDLAFLPTEAIAIDWTQTGVIYAATLGGSVYRSLIGEEPVIDSVIGNGVSLSSPFAVSVKELEPLEIKVAAHDPAGKTLTWEAYYAGVKIASPGTEGDPDQQPTFDPVNQVFRWTPPYGAAATGLELVTFVAGNGAFSVAAEVSIEVVAIHPPEVDTVVANGQLLSKPYGVQLKEIESLSLTLTGHDSDGETVTYSAFYGSQQLPAPGEVANPYATMTFDPETRTFRWQPPYGAGSAEPYPIAIVLSDGLLSTVVSIDILVGKIFAPVVDAVAANGQPLSEPYAVQIKEMKPLVIELAGHDPEGAPVTYTAYFGSQVLPAPGEVGNPDTTMTFDPGTRSFTWKPPYGYASETPYRIAFSLSDGLLSTVVTVDITVAPGEEILAPALSLALNDTAYHSGEVMEVRMSLSNPYSPCEIDFYVTLGTESSPLLLYFPYVKGVTLPYGFNLQNHLLLRYTFGAFPAGSFVWHGIVVPAGSDVANPDTWIASHAVTFSFGR